MAGERMFPILAGGYRVDERIAAVRKSGAMALVVQVPWSLLEPHEEQAQRNHSQSLKRLAERGGLSACEAVAIIEDRRYQRMDEGAANARLLHLAAVAEAVRRALEAAAADLDNLWRETQRQRGTHSTECSVVRAAQGRIRAFASTLVPPPAGPEGATS